MVLVGTFIYDSYACCRTWRTPFRNLITILSFSLDRTIEHGLKFFSKENFKQNIKNKTGTSNVLRHTVGRKTDFSRCFEYTYWFARIGTRTKSKSKFQVYIYTYVDFSFQRRILTKVVPDSTTSRVLLVLRSPVTRYSLYFLRHSQCVMIMTCTNPLIRFISSYSKTCLFTVTMNTMMIHVI